MALFELGATRPPLDVDILGETESSLIHYGWQLWDKPRIRIMAPRVVLIVLGETFPGRVDRP